MGKVLECCRLTSSPREVHNKCLYMDVRGSECWVCLANFRHPHGILEKALWCRRFRQLDIHGIREESINGIIESLRLEKTFKIECNHQPSTTTMFITNHSSGAIFKCFLNTFSNGDSTITLGSSFQCLTTISVIFFSPNS